MVFSDAMAFSDALVFSDAAGFSDAIGLSESFLTLWFLLMLRSFPIPHLFSLDRPSDRRSDTCGRRFRRGRGGLRRACQNYEGQDNTCPRRGPATRLGGGPWAVPLAVVLLRDRHRGAGSRRLVDHFAAGRGKQHGGSASQFPAWKSACLMRPSWVGFRASWGDSVWRATWNPKLPTEEREGIQRRRRLRDLLMSWSAVFSSSSRTAPLSLFR